jgi:hypothetical protein
MHRAYLPHLSALAACLLLSAMALAERNPADYPLRVHIFMLNGYSHYYRQGSTSGGFTSLDAVDGEGRANLYENGQPRGFDFSYVCSRRLMASPGFETYLARWKKQDRVLEVLQPVMGGKLGEMDGCEFKVTMKDTAYFRANSGVGEEPVAEFKSWMDKHQYDPEHGKNMPVYPPQQPATVQPAPGQLTPGQAGGSASPTH